MKDQSLNSRAGRRAAAGRARARRDVRTTPLEDLEPRRLMCGFPLTPELVGRLGDAAARTAAYSDANHPLMVGPLQAGPDFTANGLANGVGGAVQFAVIGDYGFDSPAEAAVAARVKSWDPDFIVTVGDNNYTLGSVATIDAQIGKYYQEYIGAYKGSYGPGAGTAAQSRFFPVMGNHDWDSPDKQAQPYLNYFTLPQGSSGNERYYDYVQGPIHFFAIDSDLRYEPDGVTPDSVQGQWLRNALAASTSEWNVVVFHHPPYKSGENPDTPYMDWPFKEWGADVLLTGHDHTYERIVRAGDVPVLINGLGGRSRYEFIDSRITGGSVVRYNDTFGAMLVDADASAMTFRFMTHEGELIDTYTINADDNPPPAPSGLNATAVAPGQIDVTWNDNSGGNNNRASEFQLERSTNGGANWTILARLGPGAEGYHDLGLTAGTTYTYRVAAVNRVGASAFAPSDSAVATAANPAPSTIFAAGSTWRFLDNGSNQGTAWRGVDFDDGAWRSGPARLGYGRGGEATRVSFGPDPTNKYITTYFRKTFNVDDPSAIQTLLGRIQRDDGAVVYLNGTEVFRINLPDGGPILFDTRAVRNSETAMFRRFNLSPDLLRTGENVIAVEIHQFAAPLPAIVNNPDLAFDMSLSAGGVWGAPVNDLAAAAASTTQINLSWRTDLINDAPAGSALRYRVERSTDGVEFVPRATVSSINFNDTGLSPSTLYYYRVTPFLESTGAPAQFQGEGLPATATATTRQVGPSGDVVDVAPDPRPVASPAVNAVTITFSEPVTGLELSDLTLKRDTAFPGLVAPSGASRLSLPVLPSISTAPGCEGCGGCFSPGTIVGEAIQIAAPAAQAQDAWAPLAAADPAPAAAPAALEGENLLTGAQTLTTTDNVTWTLGNLSGITTAEGRYVLVLDGATAGVTDMTGGDPLVGRVGEAWVVDLTKPPTPPKPDLVATHDSGVSNTDNLTRLPAVVISGFSEALNFIRLFDVTGGGSVLLNTVVANDVSVWTLATPALTEGVHDIAADTVDAAGNVSDRSPALQVTIDLTEPTAAIAPVSPDPRTTPVNSVTINFSERVVNLDLSDLRLTRDGGPTNLLEGAPAPTLTSNANGDVWTLSGLASRTGEAGSYALALQAGDVRDRAGNGLAAGATETWTTNPSGPAVVGRRVFYNRSAWDGNNAAAGAADDAAIATDKAALRPGQTATFANYTSYSRGINGVMVDMAILPAGDGPGPEDFAFKFGNDNTPADWATLGTQPAVTVRRGAGVNNSDRVTLVWPDNTVQKTWLQVTVKATTATGLATPDVFYFGNAVAESGNSAADARVTPADELGARSNPRGSANPAPLDLRWDYNRDRMVNSGDQLLARGNQTTTFTALKLISVPAGGALRSGAPARRRGAPASAALPLARPVLLFADPTTRPARRNEELL